MADKIPHVKYMGIPLYFDDPITRVYTHPQPDPARLMRYYRCFLVSLKKKWMGHGMGHRCLRAHMHYRGYIDQYLAAKSLASSGGNEHE